MEFEQRRYIKGTKQYSYKAVLLSSKNSTYIENSILDKQQLDSYNKTIAWLENMGLYLPCSASQYEDFIFKNLDSFTSDELSKYNSLVCKWHHRNNLPNPTANLPCQLLKELSKDIARCHIFDFNEIFQFLAYLQQDSTSGSLNPNYFLFILVFIFGLRVTHLYHLHSSDIKVHPYYFRILTRIQVDNKMAVIKEYEIRRETGEIKYDEQFMQFKKANTSLSNLLRVNFPQTMCSIINDHPQLDCLMFTSGCFQDRNASTHDLYLYRSILLRFIGYYISNSNSPLENNARRNLNKKQRIGLRTDNIEKILSLFHIALKPSQTDIDLMKQYSTDSCRYTKKCEIAKLADKFIRKIKYYQFS